MPCWPRCMPCEIRCLGMKLSISGRKCRSLLRGLYYEGWHPGTRRAARSRPAFLERIHDSLNRDLGIDPEQVARAVFAMLTARLPAAEVEDAKAATPKSLHNLWPS